MKLLDVNVVVAAGRPDHSHHDGVRAWLDETLPTVDAFTVPDVVLASYVRLVTNGRVFPVPASPTEAFAYVHEMQNHPKFAAVVPGAAHLEHFERLCVDFDVRGSRVTDAYLAAIAIEHACTLVSLDRDFARFEGLVWERPT